MKKAYKFKKSRIINKIKNYSLKKTKMPSTRQLQHLYNKFTANPGHMQEKKNF